MALKRHHLVFIILSAVAGSATADQTNNMFGTWDSLTLSGNYGLLSPDWSAFRWLIMNQVRLRNDNPSDIRLSEDLLFSQVGYDINEHSSIWIGYVHDWIHPLDKPAGQESRPYEDFLWVYPVFDGRFTSRSRLEQRINQATGDVGVRYRQMLQINYPLPWLDGLGVYLGDEVLAYVNQNSFGRTGFSENRAMAGLTYNFDKHLGFDIGYLGQYVSLQGKADLFTQNLQFNLRYGF